MKQAKLNIQIATERACSDSHVASELRKVVTEHMSDLIVMGADFIKQYTDFEDYYESKLKRIAEFKYQTEFGRSDVVIELLSIIMPSTIPQQIQSVAARLAPKLGIYDLVDSIKVAAELIGVVSHTGAYEFIQPRDSETGSILVRSNFEPSQEMTDLVNAGAYLPPMIIKPRTLMNNKDSAYYTDKNGVTLGKGNYHPYALPLDVLNADNAIALCIDTRMLAFTEEPKNAFDSGKKYDECPVHLRPLYVERKRASFANLVDSSNNVYDYLLDNGNEFHLTHRIDERIRFYDQGYYIGHQASNFKKALIDTHEKELITGYVPKVNLPMVCTGIKQIKGGKWTATITVKGVKTVSEYGTKLEAVQDRDNYIIANGLQKSHKLNLPK